MRIQRFDDEALVFNPLTWETHFLNGVAARVLDAVSETPTTQAQLVGELCGADEDEAMCAEIVKFLGELETSGLIEKVGEDRRTR
jgi:PqqD family protein of HPr-rel-A system